MDSDFENFSFYYQDGFNLSEAFPNCRGFSIISGVGQIIESNGNAIYVVKPELLNNNTIHPNIEYIDEDGQKCNVKLHVRSWRNDGPRLKETTKFGWIKGTKLFFYLNLIAQKYFGCGYSTILLTKDGKTYYSKGNKLCCYTKDAHTVLSKGPKIINPIYNEMIVEGKIGFIRTDKYIYFSEDGLHTWSLIYEGKRGIKDSMIWLPEEKSLLFSEYSPGLDFQRHHIYKYNPSTNSTRTVMTFYKREENQKLGLSPYCRHIHCMQRDPYTGHIYLGVGDLDDESAIYRSVDNGENFELLGSGNQNFRTLSFLFTPDYIFWNTDSGRAPQYLHSVKRTELFNLPVDSDNIVHHPIINSASWNSFWDVKTDMFIMSSSCEGCHYDTKYRVFGIRVLDGKPDIFCLFEEKPLNDRKSNQLFVLGKDVNDIYWFYDTNHNYYRKFVLF